MTTKNKAIVKIYGQEYAIVSDKDREYIQRLSNYVDDKMREISGKNKKLSTAMVAVLAALNMSEELFGEKEKIDELEDTNMAPDKAIMGMEKLLNEFPYYTIAEIPKDMYPQATNEKATPTIFGKSIRDPRFR